MSNTAKSASERAFQDNFVKELEKFKWKAPDELNGNLQEVTVDDMIAFWRKELNRINADQLEGVELTDNEFQQVLAKVNQINNSYEAAKILSAENSIGKIDGIYRDDNPKVTRKQITLTIFRKAEVRGGDSSYRIAREVRTKNNNRFDIVLLINGLPLINIEQKRTDKNLEEAYFQFKRYYRDGEYCNNFMAFSQMMVITTEIETRYFATPKSIEDFNSSFVFHWADEKNKPINDYREIIKAFLMIPMAHQMVGDYLVIDEAEREEDRRHLLLRPYQVYALRAIEKAAMGYDTEERIPHGGFVWHTTGSGKTITSFKTALFLATRAGFDKVVFLVDRKELDSNTSKKFKEYSKFEPVDVDDTPYTHKLKKRLENSNSSIIVTTTHKLSALVKHYNEQKDFSVADKKIIFIIDEAHRSTMGEMMQIIREYFKKNGLFFGFTGTPLFDENSVKGRVNEYSELIKTTEGLFGPMLHEYTIDAAIADGNVLGFHVDYINTGEFESYDKLREKIVAARKIENPEMSERQIEREVMLLSELEVEKEAVERSILIYQDEVHIPKVVSEILDNWDAQSQNRYFNAILTARFKTRVIAYYHEFKRQMQERGMKLNIAMTFSVGNENGDDSEDNMQVVPDEILEEMLSDYREFTNLNLSVEDIKSGRKNDYFEDLIERTKRGGSGISDKNIDLVIVADQLLTGYDSKRLNTLYVDRTLELQSLIQAYSRTNRLFGKQKEFGTIINFQYPAITKKCVEDALKLYGSGGKSSKVLVDTYVVAAAKFRNLVEAMVDTLRDPSQWQSLETMPKEKEAFIKAHRAAAEQLNCLQQYYEYSWNDEVFGIDEHTWKKYVGAYRNLTRIIVDPPVPVPIRQLGKTKLTGTDVIDANHLLKLIGSKTRSSGGVQYVDDETLRIIYEQIQEVSDLGDSVKAELLRRFVNEELLQGKVLSTIPFDVAFERWCQQEMNNLISGIAMNWGLDKDILAKAVESYDASEPDKIPYMEELVKTLDYDKATEKAANILAHNMELRMKLPKEIREIRDKYL